MTQSSAPSAGPSSSATGLIFSDSLYGILKPTATIVLPAFGTLYFALAQIWGLPAAEQVIGTIAAVNTFIGALLGLSTRSYNASDARYDGGINVTTDDEGKKVFSLEFQNDPYNLDQKDSVTFKVNKSAA